jgi:hypothetical protein
MSLKTSSATNFGSLGLKPAIVRRFGTTEMTGIAGQSSDDRDQYEFRGGCDEWGCGTNGSTLQGVLLNGLTLKQKVGSGESVVNAVILPTGEVVDPR